LELERDVPNFIQEQRSVISQLKAADLLRDRTCEGATLVTKKLAFDQADRNCSTVDFYQCPALSPASIMNGARNQFFPGARFSQKQHTRIGSCHHFDLLQDLPQSRTLSYNSGKTGYRIDFVLSDDLLIQALTIRDNSGQ
jgi:hypothetical protein